MKVQATDEQRIRIASNLINEQVKNYSDKFGIHDKQDLLAMVALDGLINALQLKDRTTDTAQTLTTQLDELVTQVERACTQMLP